MSVYIVPSLPYPRYFQPKHRYNKICVSFHHTLVVKNAQHTSLLAILWLICSNTSEKRSNSKT